MSYNDEIDREKIEEKIKEALNMIVPQIVTQIIRDIKKDMPEQRVVEEMAQNLEIEIHKKSEERLEGGEYIPPYDKLKSKINIFASFLKAIANNDRLSILFLLKNGSMYFSELLEITGLGPGPLTHHLSRLESEGLIIQERSRGKYVITKKGLKTLEVISSLEEVME